MPVTKVKTDKIKNKKDLGFQVAVSKTFKVGTPTMWNFILSEAGIQIWLGEMNTDDFELQTQFVTKTGIKVKLTIFKPDCHLRFKWQPSTFEKSSTVELRITNTKGKARIIFHHTGFFKIEQQEELRTYWKTIIDKINNALSIQNG
jgi:activator of HSP90 ATPase